MNINTSSQINESLIKGIYYDERKQSYTVDFFKTVKGKRIHVYGSNYPDIEVALKSKEVLLNRKIKEANNSKQVSFEEFFKKYIEYRSHHVRYSSLSQATTVYHKYFIEDKDKSVRDLLGFINLTRIYDEVIYDASLSPSWKNRIIGILRNMCSCAFKWKVIDSDTHQDDIALLENIPERRKKIERPIWSKNEETKFLGVINDPTHKVMFSLFLELGARISEFLGLTWDVYDGKKGTIAICKQLLHASQKTFVLSDILKTKESYRICKLRKEMKDMLNEYRKAQQKSSYLFCSNQDPALPYSKAAFRKLFHHYIDKAGIKRITPHCVRHAKATKLLKVCKNMIEVKAVAKYMGHSPTILLDVYSHSDDSIIDKVLKRLE